MIREKYKLQLLCSLVLWWCLLFFSGARASWKDVKRKNDQQHFFSVHISTGFSRKRFQICFDIHTYVTLTFCTIKSSFKFHALKHILKNGIFGYKVACDITSPWTFAYTLPGEQDLDEQPAYCYKLLHNWHGPLAFSLVICISVQASERSYLKQVSRLFLMASLIALEDYMLYFRSFFFRLFCK